MSGSGVEGAVNISSRGFTVRRWPGTASVPSALGGDVFGSLPSDGGLVTAFTDCGAASFGWFETGTSGPADGLGFDLANENSSRCVGKTPGHLTPIGASRRVFFVEELTRS